MTMVIEATRTSVEPSATVREAAARRSAALGAAGRATAPNDGERARLVDTPAQVRAKLVDRGGKQFYQLEGYASVVERAYEMWDFFGPYEEVIDARAFDQTLAAQPDVAFLINHAGLTLARTTAGTLELSVDSQGLKSVAYLNPQRDEARNLALAIEDRNVTEMSFAFMIDDAGWNEDFSEFRISRLNLDRGDVSAVNYGANPFTSIAARAASLVREAQQLPAGARRALAARLAEPADDQAEPTLAVQSPLVDVGTMLSELDAETAPAPQTSGREAAKPAGQRRSVTHWEALLELE